MHFTKGFILFAIYIFFITLGAGGVAVASLIEVHAQEKGGWVYNSLFCRAAYTLLICSGFAVLYYCLIDGGFKMARIVFRAYGATAAKSFMLVSLLCLGGIEYVRKAIVKRSVSKHQQAKAEFEAERKYYDPDR